MVSWQELGIDVKNKTTGNLKVSCPKCIDTRKNKRDKSLSVNLDDGIYNCHHCGWHGSTKTYEKKEYVRPQEIKLPLDEKAEKWFVETRKISKNTILRFKIVSKKQWLPQAEKEVSCICFTYYRKEQPVNIKYRDGAKNFMLEKGAELVFYNLDAIEKTSDCIITEGEIDCLTAYDCGFYNVVSVPNGASKGNQRLEYLDNCIDYFINKTKVVIATDGDEAGVSLRNELSRRIGMDKCWFVYYPEGCKDLNDVLVKYGKEEVSKCLNSAKQPPVEGIFTLDDVEEDLDYTYEHGYAPVDKTGFYDFDKLIGFAMRRLTIWTGIPNSGKSDFLDQVLIRLCNRCGWKAGYFSPERQPVDLHISKLAAVYIGKPFYRFDNQSKMDKAELDKAKKFIREHFVFFNVDDVDCTIDGLLGKGRELVQRMGINCLVIDPFNYIENKRPTRMSETEYISEVLGKMKKFANQNICHVHLVAHPTKMQKDKKTGKFEVPNLYSVAGSQNFFAKIDNGITVYRNDDTGIVDIHIQKAKYFWEGKKGYASFNYDVYTARYAPVLSEGFEKEYMALTNTVTQEKLSFEEKNGYPEEWK